MDSFSDRLKTVLADPEAMAKIADLAKGFAAGHSAEASPPAVVPAPQNGPTGENPLHELVHSPAISAALKLLNDGSRERIALLQAMRPFVREEKKQKLDHIIQTMQLLDVLSSAQKFI